MADSVLETRGGLLAGLAKRCYFAGRAVMETLLRPQGIGATEWYVLHRLTTSGPTLQRDLTRVLEVERATLSVVVASLVSKGLIEQVPDVRDTRRRVLRTTTRGDELWTRLPDLAAVIHGAAFGDADEADVEAAIRVLRLGAERLDDIAARETAR